MAMAFAILIIATSAFSISTRGRFYAKSWAAMVLALVLSLAGDVFLMLNGLFPAW
jgi:uncharacterized membrane protein YhhN